MKKLIKQVLQWGIAKDITGLAGRGTPIAQAGKMLSEAVETLEAVIAKDITKVKDGIGDTFVTLILLAEMHGLSSKECLQFAYDEIKGRKGTMVGGTFVKEK